MNGDELRERFAQKLRKRADARRPPDFRTHPAGPAADGAWPALPERSAVPPEFSESLRRDTADVMAGRWRAFGHLQLYVDDPPRWFTDYSVRRDVTTGQSGFHANHRELPPGCDVKLIWELSRWQPLVRLAQSAWLDGDTAAARKLIEWLADWRKHNPPYIGWNWTSALESGIRLLNLGWIDALLQASSADFDRGAWDRLRERLLAPHVWYTWRHRCFGSSANNHLLGELAGLIAAIARWPGLARWGAPLADLQTLWEREVLAQFAPDGGNREQALNYQIFSWELCWHPRNALHLAGRTIDPAVEERLRRAADFYVAVQSPADAWDYGDSDSATVVPLFANETKAGQEWLEWLAEPAGSPTLRWWLGDPPAPMDPPAWKRPSPADDWMVFPDTGQAVCWQEGWLARWDLSPLGYLSTAAHGHLDALHLSLWLRGTAIVVDPGTGAYYGDTRLRAWLASWAAHNGPHLPGAKSPRRLGPFLWSDHHGQPQVQAIDNRTLAGALDLPHGRPRRLIRRLLRDHEDGWQIEDRFLPPTAPAGSRDAVAPDPIPEFRVAWQFPPGTRLEPDPVRPRQYIGRRRSVAFRLILDPAWSAVELVAETPVSSRLPVTGDLMGLCSPAFRWIDAGPRFLLKARNPGDRPFRTTFLVEPDVL